jgi:hypothetical protein
MAVITKHRPNRPHTRQSTSTTTTTSIEYEVKRVKIDKGKEEFDIRKYQASINSQYAKEADLLYQKTEDQPDESVETLVLLLIGRRMGEEEIPEGWEKPIGLKVNSTIRFEKIKDKFKENRGYKGEIVLALNGVRMAYGTPQDIGVTNETCFGISYSKLC